MSRRTDEKDSSFAGNRNRLYAGTTTTKLYHNGTAFPTPSRRIDGDCSLNPNTRTRFVVDVMCTAGNAFPVSDLAPLSCLKLSVSSASQCIALQCIALHTNEEVVAEEEERRDRHSYKFIRFP